MPTTVPSKPTIGRHRRHHVQRIRLLLLQAQFGGGHVGHARGQRPRRQMALRDHPRQDARQAAVGAVDPFAQLLERAGLPQCLRFIRQVRRRHLDEPEVRQPLEHHRQRQHRQRSDHDDTDAAVGKFGHEIEFLHRHPFEAVHDGVDACKCSIGIPYSCNINCYLIAQYIDPDEKKGRRTPPLLLQCPASGN
jgi:hypothetical protein